MKMQVIGVKELVERLVEIPPEIQRTAESLLRQEARAIAVDLARTATMPFGFNEPNKSRARVKNGVRRVYVSLEHPSRVYDHIKTQSPQDAAIFWKYHDQNNTAAMKRIALKYGIGTGVDVSLLKGARTGPNRTVPKDQQPLRLGRETTVENLAVKEAMRVGLAKAGWVRAALSMGGRIRRGGGAQGGTTEIIPAWLRKLAREPSLGTSSFTESGTKITLTLTNSVRYADGAVDEALMEAAVSRGRDRFVKALLHSVKALAKKLQKAA